MPRGFFCVLLRNSMPHLHWPPIWNQAFSPVHPENEEYWRIDAVRKMDIAVRVAAELKGQGPPIFPPKTGPAMAPLGGRSWGRRKKADPPTSCRSIPVLEIAEPGNG